MILNNTGGEIAELYRNRKGYFSINVQVVCNADLKIIDIVARWYGSTHDTTIFNNSRLRASFEAGKFNNGLLLGDAGYPVKSYLMTPLDNPESREEHLYNEAHIRTRNTVERLFGVWKRRFPILALGMRMQVDKVLAIIVATAVLHNIARLEREAEPIDGPALQLPAPWEELLDDGYIENLNNNLHVRNHRNNAVRNQLINEYFGSL